MAGNLKILCIDDEDMILNAYKRVFRNKDKYDVVVVNDVREYDLMDALSFDIVICDQRMPGVLGTDVLKKLGELGYHGKKIICSAYADFDDIMNAFNEELIDYFLNKTWSNQEIRNLVDSFNPTNKSNSVQQSYNIEDVYLLADKAAVTDIAINIQGETGTGKEVLTRYIHNQSKRRDGPCITVNCSTLTASLFESLMFGHKKGAFTGATQDHIGFYEAASGGTLFLDEVVDIPPESQAKILRALQENVITRLGDSHDINVDVRVISASAKPIQEAVEEGLFREDLMYRLNVFPLHIPPLRKRKSEIKKLLDQYLSKFNYHEDWPEITFGEGVEALLMEYEWPGNIRELENTCNYLNVSLTKPVVNITDLPINIINWQKAKNKIKADNSDVQLEGVTNTPESESVMSIKQALEQCDNNKSKAAKLLGISRMTLWRQLNKQ
jgi:DNA-binding NtrC family response regulator